MKPQRWYEIQQGKLHVYDAPRPEQASSVSVTRAEDLGWYRRRFCLEKVWTHEDSF